MEVNHAAFAPKSELERGGAELADTAIALAGAAPEIRVATETVEIIEVTNVSGSVLPAAASETEGPAVGETVFRVWGGESGPFGHSWTSVDPDSISDFRDLAGLPDVNSGEWTSVGTLTNTDGIGARDALPLDGNQGGLPEYTVPNPQTQIEPRYSIKNDPPK